MHVYKLCIFLNLFIDREGERETERENDQAGEGHRDRQRIPSRLHTASTEPNAGLKLTNREIMT